MLIHAPTITSHARHRDLELLPLYYLAFYVIQHYGDPSFQFAGIWDFQLDTCSLEGIGYQP